MYTHVSGDDVSGLSAADLAQRLVEHSSSRLKAKHAAVRCPPAPRASLPTRVQALVWSTASSCGAAPRSALLRGDVVQEAVGDTGGVLLSLSLSPDVRFHFAQTRQRRLLGVLSARSAAASLHLSAVETAHFYWMDEYSAGAVHDGRYCSTVLQKKVLSWALNTFSSNPLLKNIPMQTIEAAFPALRACTPTEREELAKRAAELLGRDTVIWYGGTLIRQHRDSPSFLLFPLLTPREERCAATRLFALANTHHLLAGRLSDASHAAQYLLVTYGATSVALSPALTRALVLVTAALADLYPVAGRTGRTVREIVRGYLAQVSGASREDLARIVGCTEANPPPRVSALLGHLRDVTRRTCCRPPRRPLPNRDVRASAPTAEQEDDVNAFFSVNDGLHVCGDTLRGSLAAGASTPLPPSAASASECAHRVCLLGWVTRWWEGGTQSRHTGPAEAETELRIDARTAAAALRDLVTGEHALLAVEQHARKRRRGEGAQVTSHTVQADLEEAGVRLKRRSFLQFVDTLALSDDHKSRIDAAAHFLQQQHVGEAHIRRFTDLLTGMEEM